MKKYSEPTLTQLKRFHVEGGDVLHALKKSDNTFINFGEVYFSIINEGCIKAWKRHNLMTLNLVCPIGKVLIVLLIDSENGIYRTEEIGESRYLRLTIPPGIWFGFKGIGDGSSLIMNVADIEHDPNEVDRCDCSEFNFNWY
jgi:dTDP-4-dehydrorhamnose 3,5-epimerase